ncbi:uncharacterized protein LOC124409817 isoform X1 [Diprion similis]|uniref:uncharacterized protein LOC124409817 isoform X1 n=1 Tax=Diprion similis TaxID=362088 RepID=UPI001EF801F8|nr:uncharacterized protein LOC124409817 isoform X1 [Diprion similis]
MSSPVKRMTVFTTAGAVLLVLVLLATDTDARPSGSSLSRQKRVSDQRLAELETLLALSKLRGQLVTVPVAFGQVDPNKIGRRRRSMESGLQRLQRLLQEAAEQDSLSVGQESDESFQSYFNNHQHRQGAETEEQLV